MAKTEAELLNALAEAQSLRYQLSEAKRDGHAWARLVAIQQSHLLALGKAAPGYERERDRYQVELIFSVFL